MRTRQHGFTLVAAIFILVALTALAAAMVHLTTTQQIGAAEDVLGSQAISAARAGIDWGIYQVVKNPAGNFASSCTPQTLSGLPGLPGFSILVECTQSAYSEGAVAGNAYRISATACNSASCPSTTPTITYAERRLEAVVFP